MSDPPDCRSSAVVEKNTPATAGEYRNPRRDVPIALLINVTIVTLLYVGVQMVALGTLPLAGESATPLAHAADLFLGSWAGLLLTIGAALSILGTNGNTVLAGPRYLYALALDGFGPRVLARVHPRFRTPAAAVILQTTASVNETREAGSGLARSSSPTMRPSNR